MAPNGSQRLPTAPYDYKHTLLLFSSSMTPTDFHLLPPRELTPQPYSKVAVKKVKEALVEESAKLAELEGRLAETRAADAPPLGFRAGAAPA